MVCLNKTDKVNGVIVESYKNEKELIHFLKKKNFFSVKLSELSVEEQIKLFNDAQIVIGLHGAGLANLIWCNKYT